MQGQHGTRHIQEIQRFPSPPKLTCMSAHASLVLPSSSPRTTVYPESSRTLHSKVKEQNHMNTLLCLNLLVLLINMLSCVFHPSEMGTCRLVWPTGKVRVAIWNLPGRSRGQPTPSAHGPSLALQFPQEEALLGVSWMNSDACSFQSRARNSGHRKTLGSGDFEAVGISDGVESSPGGLGQDRPVSGSPVSHDRARVPAEILEE